jgi:hypothetical protein
VLLVEINVVHGPAITILITFVFNPVALEAEVSRILLIWLSQVDVDNAATTLD